MCVKKDTADIVKIVQAGKTIKVEEQHELSDLSVRETVIKVFSA